MQHNSYNNPILVTGAHRSGTTWVGKMLAASGETAYISEPLNLWHRPGVFNAPVKHWYTYIHHHNQERFAKAFSDLLSYRYHLSNEIKSLRSTKDLLRMLRDINTFFFGKLGHKRVLLKDPFAVFSIPWFVDNLDCQVILVVRHPAGVASSLKRLEWRYDFNDLLAQQELIGDLLSNYRLEMEKLARGTEDIIAQSSLLWRMIYDCALRFDTHPNKVMIVKHEELSQNPLKNFKKIYTWLGLKFTDKVEKAILKSTGAQNPKQLTKRKIHSTRLNSKANLENWKKRLSPEEISRIYKATEDIAAKYYSESEWE